MWPKDLAKAFEKALSRVEAQTSRIDDIAGQLDVLRDEVEGHTDHQV